jgi:hypothetical protein
VHSNPTRWVLARIRVSDTPNNQARSPIGRPAESTRLTARRPAAPHPGGSAVPSQGHATKTILPAPAHARAIHHTDHGRTGTPIERPQT